MAYQVYIASDNLIELTELKDDAAAYVNDATVTFYLCREAALHPTAAGVAVDAGAGHVTIPLVAHGLTTADSVKIQGTLSYDGEFPIDAVTANTITIDFTALSGYVAETFIGTEDIYVGLRQAFGLAMVHGGGDADGYYSCVMPADTTGFDESDTYRAFMTIVHDAVQFTISQTWEAIYYTGE